MPEPILVAKDIVGGYSDLDILKGASVAVHPGEVVCVIGPNGAGKSTLLKAIVGLVRIRSGNVLVGGVDVTGRQPAQLVGAGVGYVPQVSNVFPKLTVSENLDMGAFLRRDDTTEVRERVYRIFPLLKERANERVGRMSGGQRQMVAIGRALMMEPKVLLLDEPSAGLAPNLQDQVFDQVRTIAATGTAVLLVEQNAKKALAKSDRGLVLDQGQNRYEGRGIDLLMDEKVGRLYLGGGAEPGSETSSR
ncbi:MAG TPA: ABC transporter ATP-binding protein [Candidatus Thermoplasmatota archaeon]|nr:ABC transporter ATP-binding protein [Candidatus Thermoplasmatota archaeon]